ncbi:hypothetical protein [Deinococcus navajonensis]|uniref:Uncharacterized protein n=1 Tax=Deinococcus navajonensis TaxID=309884 RepID=A0ABV8XLL3_9DEIO
MTHSSSSMFFDLSTQDITVIGVRGVHGNFLPTGFQVADPADPGKTLTVQAGGIKAIGGVPAQTPTRCP